MFALKSLLASTVATVMTMTSPAINWGLGTNVGPEQPPHIPNGAETLFQQYDGLYKVNTDEKKVFFTFDLGYEAGYTAEVLDILKANDIKAIFFLCGHYLNETELVTRMINEGHVIGNHTDKHKDLPTLSRDEIHKDIADFQTKFTERFPDAKAPTFFRPGKGRFDEKTLAVAKENNLKTMLWSIAIVDWGKSPIDAPASADKIMKRIHPGAIILLHISNSGMPEMLNLLIPKITEKGYSVGTPVVL